MLCEGRVSWIQAHMFYFLPTCIHILQLYKVSNVGPWAPIFSCFQVALIFVSSRFENPLSSTSYFSTVLNSKNMPFECNMIDVTWLTKQYFNIGINYYFHMPHKVDGEGFLSQILTLKTALLDKKSNC